MTKVETFIYYLGTLLIGMNRKFFLLSFSFFGFIISSVWFFLSEFSLDEPYLILPSISLLFFLVSSWAIWQYNYIRSFSIIFSFVLCFFAVSSFVFQFDSALGYLVFLCTPIVLLLVGGGVLSLFFDLFLLLACLLLISFGSFDDRELSVILVFSFAIQFIGKLIFLSIVSVLKARLSDTKKQLRISTSDYRTKEAYMAGLSHQIRTPLSSIIGITDLMRNNGVSDLQKEMLDGIVTSSNNLLTISNDIMNNVNVILEGNVADTDNEFSISQVLEEYSQNKENNIGREGSAIELNFTYSQYLPKKLNGNSSTIVQTLDKILKSIVDYVSSSTIDVYVYDKKETVNSLELLVEVHLPALSLLAQDRLSFSEDCEYDEIVLSKLGLTELFDDITAKGGNFSLRFSSSNMTVISYTVLYWKGNADKMVVDKIQKAIKVAEQKNRNRMTDASVLVVEDNLMNQKVVSMALKNKVKKVDIANNGKEAVHMFSSTKYDLILMDLMMPVMDGYKATEKIRELESGTDMHTPIIALTANARAGVREGCLESGMDDYLTKPFKFDALISKVEEYLMSIT